MSKIIPPLQDPGTFPVARRYQLKRWEKDDHGITIWTSGPASSGFRISSDTLEALLDALVASGHPRVTE